MICDFMRTTITTTYQRLRRLARRVLRPESQLTLRSAQTLDRRAFLGRCAVPAVQAALRADALDAAETALLQHVTERIANGDWPALPALVEDLDLDLAATDDATLLALADRLLAHRIAFGRYAQEHHLGEAIDWHANPTSEREWALTLHRHAWWLALAAAFGRSADRRYAAEIGNQLRSWIAACPIAPVKNEALVDWRLMEVALRVSGSWTPALGAIWQTLDTDTRLLALRALLDHAQFLHAFKSRGNHLVRESVSLAYCGVHLNFFADAPAWERTGLTRLRAEVERQVNADGFQSEVSTGYQWLVLDELRRAYDLTRADHPVFSRGELGARLTTMYAVVAATIRPDGSFPQINDGVLDPDTILLAKLGEAAELLDNDELRFIASRGAQGVAPPLSRLLPDGGFAVMRSDWAPDARYALFDAGPFGGNHGHEDKLSLEVSAFGQPLLVDPGSYTYDPADPFRAYFVGSHGHNTVTVNGLSQIRRWQPGALEHAARPGKYLSWQSTARYDLAEAQYTDGYGEYRFDPPFERLARLTGVTHRRRVLFVKPDYWIVLDDLSAATAQRYEQRWHAAPQLAAETLGDRVVLRGPEGVGLLIAAAAPPDALELVCGQEHPPQGWYSAGYYHKTPAAAAAFVTSGSSVSLTTLLYPLRTDSDPAAVQIARAGETLCVQLPGRTDQITLGATPAIKQEVTR